MRAPTSGIPREGLVVCSAVFLASPGLAIITPLVAQMRDELGVSSAAAGLILSAFALARMLTNLPAGYLADRFSRSALTVGGMAVLVAGSLVAATAPDFPRLLFGRLLMGIGSGLVLTTVVAWVVDLTDPQNRTRVISLVESANLAQATSSPLIGGLIGGFGGWRLTLFYCAAAALTSASILLIYAARRPNKVPDRVSRARAVRTETRASFEYPLTPPLLYAVGGILAFNRNGVRNYLVPLVAASTFQLEPASIGLVVTVVAGVTIASNLVGGQLADRHSQTGVLLAGIALLALGDLAFLASSSYSGLLMAAVALGLGGFGLSVPPSLLSGAASAGSRGRVLGLYRFVQDGGFALGPILLGWAYDSFGYQTTLLLAAALLALLLFPAWRWIRQAGETSSSSRR